MRALQSFLESFVSFTTDMGTEMGAASFLVQDLSKLFPDWLAEPLLHMDVDNGDAEDHCAFESFKLFLPDAIVIPGALHICSNLCKDVSAKLGHWECFLTQLGQVEALLCNRDRRERFLSTCVPAGSQDRALFQHFSGSLYEKRWGAVISFLRKLFPLLDALQKYWNHEAFLEGYRQEDRNHDNPEEGPGFGFLASDLTAVLCSNQFHVYLEMVMALFNVVENLSSWFEGCACHEQHVKVRNRRAHSRKEGAQLGLQVSCPMMGKRAPQLASGCLQDTFEELSSLHKASLLKRMSSRSLSPQEEALVMQDFEAGRNYISLGLQVKFDFWGKLPWRLAALAHEDVGVARAAACDMLLKRDGLDVADPSLVHHPVTLRFLHDSSPLRGMLQSFSEGGPMSDVLRTEVSKLAFMPVVERSIEAKHSLISRRVQKHWRSGRIVSLTLRVPDIKAEMARDAAFFQELTQAFALSRDPVKAAQQLGVHEHPALVSACFAHTHKASRVGILNRIVYRCDLESKFEAHSQARAEHEQVGGKRVRLAQKALQAAKPKPAPKPFPKQRPRMQTADEGYEAMLRLAIQDHFVRVASGAISSQVYSLDLAPNEDGSLPSLIPLGAVLEREVVVAGLSAVPGAQARC